MPIGPTNTKEQKRTVVRDEMHKFGQGELHSGSKQGPVVKNRKQAIAIALSESGQSKHKSPSVGKGESKMGYDRSSHHKGNPGFGEGHGSEMKDVHRDESGYQRSGHHHEHMKHHEMHGHKEEKHHDQEHEKQPHGKGIGVGMDDGAEHHVGHGMGVGRGHAFTISKAESHGFGHTGAQKVGHHRHSGHPQAHRIGGKRRG